MLQGTLEQLFWGRWLTIRQLATATGFHADDVIDSLGRLMSAGLVVRRKGSHEPEFKRSTE